jgi:AraC family transcriptional regulator
VLKDLIDYGHKVRRLELAKNGLPLHCMAISAGYEQRRNEVYSGMDCSAARRRFW